MDEDALQDALAAVIEAWARDGVPDSSKGWLTTAARRKAIDRLRRDRSVTARTERLADLVRLDSQEEAGVSEDSSLVDDRLRLIFICCHPALDPAARVALTLRALGGLTTGEIARAFLVSEPAMGKRIVRAKRKIADAHMRTCQGPVSVRLLCGSSRPRYSWFRAQSLRLPLPRA